MTGNQSIAINKIAAATFERNMLPNGLISPQLPTFNGSFLWDTALIAEGMAVINPIDAATQITGHMQGQHLNGMLPNEVINGSVPFIPRRILRYKNQGRNVYASNITQPPTIVTATWEVALKLPKDDRIEFLKECFPVLQTYLGWIMTSRVDVTDGLPMVIHPHETGMDDNPVWEAVLRSEWSTDSLTTKERVIVSLGSKILPKFRASHGDYQDPAQPERASDTSVLYSYLQSALALKYGGNPHRLLEFGKGTVVKDVGFNALTIEANRSLINIESAIRSDWYRIDEKLYAAMRQLEWAMETTHYDDNTGAYHSIDVRTGLKLPAITASSLLPLLNTRHVERKDALVRDITDPNAYWTSVPIPSVRANNDTFNAGNYWKGGSWPFLRYQIERALRRNGNDMFAAALRSRVMYNPHAKAVSEFNNPLSGAPLGVQPFSPAAAELLLYSAIEARKG